jgi:predicted transposase YdaD
VIVNKRNKECLILYSIPMEEYSEKFSFQVISSPESKRILCSFSCLKKSIREKLLLEADEEELSSLQGKVS